MTTISFQKLTGPLQNEKETLIDLHVHSSYSLDGFTSPELLVKIAKQLGIGLAICDHNEIRGSLKAARQKEVLIIPGIEITCQNGTHLLFYFETHSELEKFFEEIIEKHRKNPFVLDLLPKEILEKSKKYECFVCAPHPLVTSEGGLQKTIQENLLKESEVEELIDCIEVVNGMNSRKRNEEAIAWAKKMKKPMTGGSDGHRNNEVGTVVTRVKGQTAQEVFNNLRGPLEIVGEETTGLKKIIAKIQKELKLILRKEGLPILINQIQRRIKK